MAADPLLNFIRRLRRARSVTEGGHLTDAQLLERFAKRRDEAAFEVLVWRHGTLVLNVAQRLLRHTADAEDVFQATFLTLARKASAIQRGKSLGSWLYKVAYRLALRARQAAARSERWEQSGIENASAPMEHGDAELSAALAQEVDRLPERFRAVVVLCYLQGVTTEQASRLLGCPRGTVLSRLASARQRLRQRLLRRGIAPAAALAAVSFGEAVSAAPAAALVASVVRVALPFAAGGAAVPMVSPQAAALAQGALQMMMWNKIKIAAALVCAIAVVGTGSGWLARGRNAVEASPPAAEPLSQKAPDPENKIIKEMDHIHVELAKLAERETDEEANLNAKEKEFRLQLLELQDELRLEEQRWDSERQQIQERQKAASSRNDQLVERMGVIDGKSEASKKLEHELVVAKVKHREIDMQLRERERQYHDLIRSRRKQVFEAEYELRRIENRQAQAREVREVKRRALLARLEQLEEKSVGLEPADRFRDVERKLDSLRREVGELRRAMERQGKGLQKKLAD